MVLLNRLTTPAVLLAAALAGCGGGDDGSSPQTAGGEETAPQRPGDAAVVELDEFSLEPAQVTVSRGATITAENVGAVAHNLTIERGPDPSAPSRELAATATFAGGGSDDVEVDLPPGRYALVCTVADHRDRGMVGTLTVE